MISEDGRDEIVSAVERRRVMLERELLTAPYECRAKIAKDIESCRSLLVKLENSPCKPPSSTTIH